MADVSYKEKKVISIGTVCELTGLSERKIRYYEERKLVFPERSNGRIRKYSFSDIETLMQIADMLEDGVQTYEIRQEMNTKKKTSDEKAARKDMIKGQLNARFGVQNKVGYRG